MSDQNLYGQLQYHYLFNSQYSNVFNAFSAASVVSFNKTAWQAVWHWQRGSGSFFMEAAKIFSSATRTTNVCFLHIWHHLKRSKQAVKECKIYFSRSIFVPSLDIRTPGDVQIEAAFTSVETSDHKIFNRKPVFQVMGTPKRAVLSSTAAQPLTQRRASSMTARTWLCLRWGRRQTLLCNKLRYSS